MQVIVYTSKIINGRTVELLESLDGKDIPYEVQQVDTAWVVVNKAKSLPMVEINGELMTTKKAMKKLKRG